MHGGKLTDQATSALKDLWRYDLVGRTWSEMHPAVAPSSRYLHNMAAWPGGHAIVLFGGEHIKSRKSGKKKYARVNDVWAGVEIKCSGASPLLDGVAVSIPHRSTEPARPRHRREMT